MTQPDTALRWPLPLDDPYPSLAQLRRAGPIHWLAELDAHLVVTHAEALGVLQGPGWSSDPTTSPALARRLGLGGDAGGGVAGRMLLFSDPPDHTRLRRSLAGHLTPRAVEAIRPRIRAIVDAAFSAADPDWLEVMDEVAYAVPLAVICELLDTGVDMAGLLRTETPKLAAILDPLVTPEEAEAGYAAALALMLELVPIVADRRRSPGLDLLSALVAGDDEDGLEPDEAVVMALLLLAAGHETTANLIGNAVVALHDRPDLVGQLRGAPEMIGSAVEELLRYDSPVQLTSRIARHDVEVAGVSVRAGGQVLVSVGGANRDPGTFPDPERLDLDRSGRSHLAFGHGAHFCAGASLARVEAQEVLSRLLRAEPPFEERPMTYERGRSATFRRVSWLRLGSGSSV